MKTGLLSLLFCWSSVFATVIGIPFYDDEAPIFQCPVEATATVGGTLIPYVVQYDPRLWYVWASPQNVTSSGTGNQIADWILLLTDVNGMANGSVARGAAYLSESNDVLSYPELQTNILTNLNSLSVGTVEIMTSEYRNVNGVIVWALAYQITYSNPQNLPDIWYNYFYTGNLGTVSVKVKTKAIFWDAEKQNIQNFLNGFSLNVQ